MKGIWRNWRYWTILLPWSFIITFGCSNVQNTTPANRSPNYSYGQTQVWFYIHSSWTMLFLYCGFQELELCFWTFDNLYLQTCWKFWKWDFLFVWSLETSAVNWSFHDLRTLRRGPLLNLGTRRLVTHFLYVCQFGGREHCRVFALSSMGGRFVTLRLIHQVKISYFVVDIQRFYWLCCRPSLE